MGIKDSKTSILNQYIYCIYDACPGNRVQRGGAVYNNLYCNDIGIFLCGYGIKTTSKNMYHLRTEQLRYTLEIRFTNTSHINTIATGKDIERSMCNRTEHGQRTQDCCSLFIVVRISVAWSSLLLLFVVVGVVVYCLVLLVVLCCCL